jgi:hypothetical protein
MKIKAAVLRDRRAPEFFVGHELVITDGPPPSPVAAPLID